MSAPARTTRREPSPTRRDGAATRQHDSGVASVTSSLAPQKAFYASGPALSLGSSIQAKLMSSPEVDPDQQTTDVASHIQRTATLPSAAPAAVPPIVDEVLKSPGRRLDPGTRASMESRFGQDFGDVRVHTDSRAAESARAVQAAAFTSGQDVVFGRDQYQAGIPSGQRLLAHELAHVVQQSGGNTDNRKEALSTEDYEHEADKAAGDVTVGKRPGRLSAFPQTRPKLLTKPDDLVIEDKSNGVSVERVEGSESISVKYNEITWIRLNTKGNRIDVQVKWITGVSGESVKDGVEITISSDSWVEANLDLSAEQPIIDANKGKNDYYIDYQFVFHGTVARGPDGAPALEKHNGPVRRVVLKTNEVLPPSEIPLPNGPMEQWLRLDVQSSVPTFKDAKAVQSFLDAHPHGRFAIIKMPDGGYASRELDDGILKQLSDTARGGDFDKDDWLSRFTWYKNNYGQGALDRFYLDGKEYRSLAELRGLYFEDEIHAWAGEKGAQEEAEIFQMARGSSTYGRKPLSHETALNRWAELDAMSLSDVLALETEPGRPFSSLAVRGATSNHIIGQDYFLARQKYRDKLDLIDERASDPIAQEEFEKESKTFDSDIGENYLRIALDKTSDDPGLVLSLKKHPLFGQTVSNAVYKRVEDAGQKFAIDSFSSTRDFLRIDLSIPEKLSPFLFNYPRLPSYKQDEILELLGLDEGDRNTWKETLANAENAAKIANGATVNGVSRDTWREKAELAAQGMDKIIASLESRELVALLVKGDFGDWVRTAVYKQFGFALNPRAFPHSDKVPSAGVISFDPMAGNRAAFVSLYEQMFAAEIRRKEAVGTIEKYAKLAGVAVASLVLVVFLNAAGAAIAGAAFTEGTLGYFAVNALVVGVGMTGVEALHAKIEGADFTWKDWLKSGAWNVLTAGLLGRLGWALKDATTVARVGWMGSAFMSAGIARFIWDKKGKFTTGELAEFMAQNAVMFAVMEGVGVITRPLNESAAVWGRARRLGELQGEMSSLQGKVVGFVGKLNAYAANPGEVAKDAVVLESTEEEILNKQAEILNKLRKSPTTKGDAANLEIEIQAELDLIRTQLDGMRKANFLSDMKIAPVEGSQVNFTYEFAGAAADAAKKMETFFPGSKAEVDPDGTIRLTLKGETEPMVLTPKGIAGPATAIPDPTVAKININAASAESLMQLTGIGQALAEKIVAEREANGDFSSVDDLVRVKGIGAAIIAKIKAQGKATVAPLPPPKPVVAWRADLNARREKLITRADALKVKDNSLETIRAMNRINSMTTEKALRAAEQAIETAEQTAGAKIRAKSLQSFAAVKQKLGTAETKRFRGGGLEDLSDAELGEALAAARAVFKTNDVLETLSVEALRGVVLAYQRGVDVGRFFSQSKGQTAEARTFALEAFAALAEANVSNIESILSDMAIQPTKWDGGMWMLEFCLKKGARNVLGLEVTDEDGGRRFDVILKNGEKFELKSWAAWDGGKVEKLRGQFLYDFGYGTISDPNVWKTHRYVFRSPSPESIQNIRAVFRSWLKQAMIDGGAPSDSRSRVLDLFDANAADMIIEIPGFWTGTPAAKISPPTVVTPVPDKDNKDKPVVPPTSTP
jgi:competence ComEA-like helix-hairpin-helix protein